MSAFSLKNSFDLDFDPTGIRGAVVQRMRRSNKIASLGFENVIDVLLRITINQREPSALHVDHDSMAFLESVTHILQRQIDFGDLARHKRLWFFIAVAETPTDDFAANHLLKPAEI